MNVVISNVWEEILSITSLTWVETPTMVGMAETMDPDSGPHGWIFDELCRDHGWNE